MASPVADIFRQAARLNAEHDGRDGNLVRIDDAEEVIVAGDLHGNRMALTKIIAHANVAHQPGRRLILQELIHGQMDPRTGKDRSVELLLRAARLKISCPHQVLFVLGNHDLAQATGNEIAKEGMGVCKAFKEGARFCFPQDAEEILSAANEFLLSMPLAVRCPNRVFVCHSMPSPRRMDLAGIDVFDRPYQDEDLHRGGAVYEWTWGRKQTPEQIERLAQELDVDFFVLGHKHILTGWEMVSPRAIVVVSDHSQGGVLQFTTDVPLTGEIAERHFRSVNVLGQPRRSPPEAS